MCKQVWKAKIFLCLSPMEREEECPCIFCQVFPHTSGELLCFLLAEDLASNFFLWQCVCVNVKAKQQFSFVQLMPYTGP